MDADGRSRSGESEPPPSGLHSDQRIRKIEKCDFRQARANGHDEFFVSTDGFDDVVLRLSLQCLTGDRLEVARDLYREIARDRKGRQLPFRVEASTINALIKSNAFPIECPSEVLQFELSGLGAGGLGRASRANRRPSRRGRA